MYTDDMDVFVTMIVFEDSPAVLSLGFLCAEMGYSYEWRKGECPSLVKNGRIIRCKLENHVPIVAVSEEPCVSPRPSPSIR